MGVGEDDARLDREEAGPAHLDAVAGRHAQKRGRFLDAADVGGVDLRRQRPDCRLRNDRRRIGPGRHDRRLRRLHFHDRHEIRRHDRLEVGGRDLRSVVARCDGQRRRAGSPEDHDENGDPCENQDAAADSETDPETTIRGGLHLHLSRPTARRGVVQRPARRGRR